MTWLPAESRISREASKPAPLALVTADDHLVAAFRDGDSAACRTIEGWVRDVLKRHPYGVRGDDVEDVVQQSLIALWRTCSREGFRLRTGLRALTRTVVMARCVDQLRRRKPLVELDDNLPDLRTGPDARAVGTDEWARVRNAIALLSEPYQEIIRLHFFDGLSYAEIAERLGRAESTLRVRVFQCMKQLRRLLAVPAM